MDYNKLLDIATDLGYELSMAGSETYRVEESITRVMASYGVHAEAFAIPNNLTVSVTLPDGSSITRMRRVGFHGNDLDAVERFSDLSRRICREKPDPDTAQALLQQARSSRRYHSFFIYLLGCFCTAAGFCIFYGGCVADALVSGLSGVVVGFCTKWMGHFKTNHFFTTFLSSIPLAFISYFFAAIGWIDNPDAAIIGTVMVLIPGLLFTYAMHDIIFGDTNSGINRIIQVLLVAVSIACGTAVAWNLATVLWGVPVSCVPLDPSFLVESIACIIGSLGFSIMFNIHGPGIALCIAGGVATWGVHSLCVYLGVDEMIAYLISSTFAAIYAETMARIRKCPVTCYLIIGLIVLIPGSSLYYTINYIVRGDMENFSRKGIATISIAGLMAAGILLVSSTVRLWTEWKKKKMQ